jgi:hypothetical protein
MQYKNIEGIKKFRMNVNLKRITRMLSINNIFHIDDKRFEGLKTKQNII